MSLRVHAPNRHLCTAHTALLLVHLPWARTGLVLCCIVCIDLAHIRTEGAPKSRCSTKGRAAPAGIAGTTWMPMLGNSCQRRRPYTASCEEQACSDCWKQRRVQGKSSFGRQKSKRRKCSSDRNCGTTWMPMQGNLPPTTSALYSKLRRADLLRLLEEERLPMEARLGQELRDYMEANALAEVAQHWPPCSPAVPAPSCASIGSLSSSSNRSKPALRNLLYRADVVGGDCPALASM